MTENDSREKLEFEIRKFIECNGWFGYPDEAEQYADARKSVYKMFIGWLDRQVAITERECCKPPKQRTGKLEADLEALQEVNKETLHSYLQLKERYRKLAKENVEMNMVLAKIYTVIDDYKEGRL